MIEEPKGDVAGPPCNVENLLGLRRGIRGGSDRRRTNTGVDGAYEAIFPETVGIEGHQVIHGVIIGSN